MNLTWLDPLVEQEIEPYIGEEEQPAQVCSSDSLAGAEKLKEYRREEGLVLKRTHSGESMESGSSGGFSASDDEDEQLEEIAAVALKNMRVNQAATAIPEGVRVKTRKESWQERQEKAQAAAHIEAGTGQAGKEAPAHEPKQAFAGRANDGTFCRLPDVREITDNATQVTFGEAATPPIVSVSEDQQGRYLVSAWLHFPLPQTGSWRTLIRASVKHDHHAVVFRSTGELGLYKGSWHGSGWSANGIAGWHHVAAVSDGARTTFYVDKEVVGIVGKAVPSNFKYLGSCVGTNQFIGKIAGVLIMSGEVPEALWKADADTMNPTPQI